MCTNSIHLKIRYIIGRRVGLCLRCVWTPHDMIVCVAPISQLGCEQACGHLHRLTVAKCKHVTQVCYKCEQDLCDRVETLIDKLHINSLPLSISVSLSLSLTHTHTMINLFAFSVCLNNPILKFLSSFFLCLSILPKPLYYLTDFVPPFSLSLSLVYRYAYI